MLALGENTTGPQLEQAQDPLYNVPLNVANPVDWVNIYRTTPTGTPIGYKEPGKQFCIGGEQSIDPLVPGVCNTTTLMGGIVLFAVLYLMSGKR